MHVEIDDVSVTLAGITVVADCGLRIASREIVGLVGPNGSGKSTLLRTIYRALRPAGGVVRLDERDVWRASARESARRTAVVAQERPVEFDFSVEEVVMMGRGPHKGVLDREGHEDRVIVAAALGEVGAVHLRGRIFATLSGGEKQRVLVARALAQRSRLLVLDEPTNHLDVRAQLDLLELVRGLGLTTIVALHDLNLAAAYCDRIAVLSAGLLVAHGAPETVLTTDLVASVFGVRAHPERHRATGRLHLHFTPLRTRAPVIGS